MRNPLSTVRKHGVVRKMHIPAAVLRNRDFSVLEAIVKYLHEDENLSYTQIAQLLNRDDRTIWTTYHRTIKKVRKVE